MPRTCCYLKGILVRADRARSDAGKDRQKAQQIAPYHEALLQMLANPGEDHSRRFLRVQDYRWLLEEWRISVFAQELGTSEKVSSRRLDLKLEEVDSA